LVAPYDEPAIVADDIIIRRVNPIEHVIYDDNRKCHRVSSKLYKASSVVNGGMSVDIEKMVVSAGIEPKIFVVNPVYTGAIAFSAVSIRSLGLWIGYEPLQNNPYHGEVWNSNPSRHNKFTGAQVSGLMAAATWYVPVKGVEVR
jgi:hypothetical protein